MSRNQIPTATSSSSIADILERVLDKGVVIAGDIRVKLVNIELLTIQIRLVICSIDKAKEIGMDWWNTSIEKKIAERNRRFKPRRGIDCIANRIR